MNMVRAIRTVRVLLIWLAWYFQEGRAQHHRQTDSQHEETPRSNTTNDALVCKARTINYITHSLPQQCLTRWPSSGYVGQRDMAITIAPDPTSILEPILGTASTDGGNSGDATTTSALEVVLDTSTESIMAPDGQTSTQLRPPYPSSSPDSVSSSEGDTQGEDLGSSFMSFEEWKAMMLKRTGQDPQDLKSRQPSRRSNDRTPPDMGQYSLGDEDEISLDFNNYLGKTDETGVRNVQRGQNIAVEEGPAHDAALYGDETVSLHRSKDAGKTCKERFSYSSFDAGATILKAAPGTKNAKAILVENKDSYMLLECALQNKFVIVELSDDILIDTIVLANFEFFSSMIRHFRLSVSDRYPVKVDKWRELGTFEARNSRDIQAFLVENPQIWAKYIRIEFLTHYGNEFYCPVSLLRIHGSRMLDSWKETETTREDEHEPLPELEGSDLVTDAKLLPGASGDHRHDDPINFMQNAEPLIHDIGIDGCLICTTSPASPLNVLSDYCQEQCGFKRNVSEDVMQVSEESKNQLEDETQARDEESLEGKGAQGGFRSSYTSPVSPASTPSANTDPGDQSNRNSANAANGTMEHANGNTAAPAAGSKPTNLSPGGSKPRAGNSNQAASASPMVQEGFFNAITKRLQNVESNLTLSLQYLENHSRYMQDTLRKAEQKQLTKASSFLDNLNHTVLSELRSFRDQYEQLWQSTIIALETQREESQRDTVALSARLNLLADEVVFQKRMAIVQAVLLLCCLFLVIFSRGVPIPYLAPFADHNGSYGGYSAPNSPPRPSKGRNHMQSSRITISDHDFSPEVYDLPQEKSELPNRTSIHADEFGLRSSGKNRVSAPADTQSLQARPGRITPTILHTCEETPEPDLPSQGGDVHNASLQQQSSFQSLQSRKPLPALPEHPSPD